MASDANEKKARIEKQIQEEANNRDSIKRQKLIKSHMDYFKSKLDKTHQKDLLKLKEKAGMYLARIEEHRKNPRSNQQYHVGSIASWIMEGSERFENIVKYLIYTNVALRQEWISKPFAKWFKSGFKYGAVSLYEYAFGEKGTNNINLDYEIKLGDHGEIDCKFLEESFGDLFKNIDGDVDKDRLDLIQAILSESVDQWVDSLDGLDLENSEGYFTAEVGGKMKIYPKSCGEKNNDDEWVLKRDPSDRNKLLYEDKFVTQDKFQEMLNGFGHTEHSFEVYVQETCPNGSTFSMKNTPTRSLTM